MARQLAREASASRRTVFHADSFPRRSSSRRGKRPRSILDSRTCPRRIGQISRVRIRPAVGISNGIPVAAAGDCAALCIRMTEFTWMGIERAGGDGRRRDARRCVRKIRRSPWQRRVLSRVRQIGTVAACSTPSTAPRDFYENRGGNAPPPPRITRRTGLGFSVASATRDPRSRILDPPLAEGEGAASDHG